jgi:hypothetical protein
MLEFEEANSILVNEYDVKCVICHKMVDPMLCAVSEDGNRRAQND